MAKVPWVGERCIACLREGALTEEHVIPEALCGRLTAWFLCNSCNSQFGHAFEPSARIDPSVRLALEALKATIPIVYARVSNGLPFTGHGPGGSVPGHIRDGEFRVRAHRGPDGTLWQPTLDARRSIETMLVRTDQQAPIAELLLQFDQLEDGKRLKLGDWLEVVKQPIEHVEAALTGPLMSELVPIKIAYEFLALHVGREIYEDIPPLRMLRGMLLSNDVDAREVSVERLLAPRYLPIHGLAFESNAPHVTVQVRLFGKVAYRVRFHRLHVAGGPRGVYTLDLQTGDERVGILGDASAAQL